MDSKVILKAEDLDGYLTERDQEYLVQMDALYERAMNSFKIISSGGYGSTLAAEEQKVIDVFNEMGSLMQQVCAEVPALQVFSFCTETGSHAEASRVIAKLRDIRTDRQQFVCYSRRAYEMLFRQQELGGARPGQLHRLHPVDGPRIENSSACIMPGLGDAGDRLNGRDSGDSPRNIIQLIAGYGTKITGLYRSQLRRIGRTVLGAV